MIKYDIPLTYIEYDIPYRDQTQCAVSSTHLAKASIAAGCPEPKGIKLRGGFEDYRRVTGGILQVAGVKGFLETP